MIAFRETPNVLSILPFQDTSISLTLALSFSLSLRVINILAAPPIGFIECADDAANGFLVPRDVGWLAVRLVSRVQLG